MATERNLLSNGRFYTDLSGWMASSASYLASDGDEQYGMASVSVGGSVSQTFAVPEARQYTLHVAVKPASTLSAGQATIDITQSGSTVVSLDLSGAAGSWTEQTFTLGLVPGADYALTINAVSVAVKVDDVWLWFVPITRAALATRVHTRLGAMAADQSLSTTASGSLTEGSYTYAIDAGLRQLGAIDPVTAQPDVRYLGTSDIDALLSIIEREMLQQLHRAYALQTDIQVGQRSENLSQIAKSLETLLSNSAAATSRQVKRARITRDDVWPDWTYENGSVDIKTRIRVRDDDGL